MNVYRRFQDASQPHIRARIYDDGAGPQAELRSSVPQRDGSDPIYIPGSPLPVKEALSRGEALAKHHELPFLVHLDDVEWQDEWGQLLE